ncbi:Putative odorant receptor 92a [Melipona quadrifasciata]|uniref:Putative odorant receptor 92a n=1 Tax=Melipona quadrifasciata TaxID=166423 RepID=A0A0M8ZNP4_9HYME|nr:Putative odorant receptor 92a [Melipona quadrifasciata]
MVGMWPIDEKSSTSSKIFAYFRAVVTVISYSFVLVPQILAIAVNWGDIKTIAARREKAHKLYNEMRNLWDSSDDPKERKSYEQIAYWARIATITFYACLMSNVISFTVSGIIDYLSNNNRHLPFDVWYGTDISASPKFEIIFFCQLLACTIGTSGVTGIDCSIMTIILHVAGQFKLIKSWMNKIGTEINREPVHLEKFETDLFKCIRHHQRIIHQSIFLLKSEIGATATSIAQALCKVVYIIARREKAYKLYNEMRSLWDTSDDPKERKSYEQIAYWARIATITFYACLMGNVISFTISGITDYLYNDNRHLPFVAWYGTDISASPRFEIVFFCQIWASIGGISGLTAVDCTVMTIILHVAGQFKLIKTWMNKIGIEINREPVHLEKFEIDLFKYGKDTSASPSFEIAFACQFLSSAICAATISGLDATFMTTILHVSGQFKLINTWITDIGVEINCEPNHRRKLMMQLIKCIRHHQRMIDVVNDVNNLLTPIIFMQLLTSGIEICLSGYAILDNGTAKADLAKFTSYFISMLVQLLVWCWPGEILVQESQNVGHVIYLNVPWYNMPLIYQKYLCLIIVRAQQYCSITALTFETLSIHTLTVVSNLNEKRIVIPAR